MSEGTTPVSPETTEPEKKTRKKPVFRFKYRLTPLEVAVQQVCAEKGLNVEDAIKDRKVVNVLIKAAMSTIRPEAIQERLEEDVTWLRTRLLQATQG